MTTTAANTDLGLYVHIPFCTRKCAYCAFYSVSIERQDTRPVIDAILTELDFYSPPEPVNTIYYGGGSPSSLPADVLCELIESITGRIGQPEECTVECNPAQANRALFSALRLRGVNRLSIGAQSFIPGELEILQRPHSAEDITQAVAEARAAGFENIGLDLIFGIPGSTAETLTESLQKAIALKPTHISVYSLTWEEGTPLTRALSQGHIQAVCEKEERRMYCRLCGMLTTSGYGQYEISNFALPYYECRHNLRYWRNQPVIGLGPAASGWYKKHRTTNIANSEKYVQRIQMGQFAYQETQHPDAMQVASETAILGLRMTAGIELAEFHRTTGYEATRLFAEAIEEHQKSGLLELTGTHLRLTEKGRSFADAVACDLIIG